VEEIEAVDCEHVSEDHLPQCTTPIWLLAFYLLPERFVEVTYVVLIVLKEKIAARM